MQELLVWGSNSEELSSEEARLLLLEWNGVFNYSGKLVPLLRVYVSG